MLFLVNGIYSDKLVAQEVDSLTKQKYSSKYITDASKIANSWLFCISKYFSGVLSINDNQYENAFLMLSHEVKAIYNKDSWISLINQLMLEFGILEGRIATEKIFKNKVEGMEDGFYVFIDYKSNYSNTINHSEHILLKQNEKKKWEIVDYNYEFRNKEK